MPKRILTKMSGDVNHAVIEQLKKKLSSEDKMIIIREANLTIAQVYSFNFASLVFKETDNAWCSWVSHSLADIVAVVVMMIIF